MGIDIYLGGYDAYERRTKQERIAFDLAVKLRNSHPKDSPEANAAQLLVESAANAMWDAGKGYLRSSYNNGGLFNVLDRIFDTDSAALLFPGDWSEDLTIDWEAFLVAVRRMQTAGKCLRHGDPLPVKLEELSAEPHPQRQHGEAFGKSVMGMISGFAEQQGDVMTVVSGNDHQHGFYNEDDYGWYVTEGLDDLRKFGELGKQLAAKGRKHKVHISY
jgi:hypothetical protein